MTLKSKRPVPLESKRIPLDRRILLRFTSFEWFAAEYSENLSMTGMFVRSSEPQPAGTPVDFEFKLEDGLPLIRGKGWVVWSREGGFGKDRPAGMGIEFLELDRESRRLIRWMVRNELPEDRKPFDLHEAQDDKLPEDDAGQHAAPGATVSWVPLVAGFLVVSLAFLGHWWLRGRGEVEPEGSETPTAAVNDVGEPPSAPAVAESAVSTAGESTALRDTRTVASRAAEKPTRTEEALIAPGAADALQEVVRNWANAWSRQDVDSYLSSYSRSFVPASEGSLEQWRATRRSRLLAPTRIRIAVTGFETISQSADKAVVRFTQAYRSETYSDTVNKTLELVREAGAWKIRSERSD
ncbi:MAG: TIGR02266 family protein [Acidobacteriota bacterium]|nr:TIGR02266 family protein [Acidobacteriota bacterium]